MRRQFLPRWIKQASTVLGIAALALSLLAGWPAFFVERSSREAVERNLLLERVRLQTQHEQETRRLLRERDAAVSRGMAQEKALRQAGLS